MSENMEKVYDVIVVGSGPAGLTAALYCARAGYETLVLEKYIPGGQMVTSNEIENYPGFPEAVDGFTLTMNMKKQAERFGAKQTYGNVTALRLDGDAKILETEDGTVYRAKSVVLAPGAAPRTLGLPNEDALRGKGVSYCATCDGAFYKDKTVAVIGGGDTAAGDAAFLSAMCKKVYLIHRRDRLRASKSYEKKLDKPNIEIVFDTVTDEILEKDGKVGGLRLRNVKTDEVCEIEVNGVFVAVGNVEIRVIGADSPILDTEVPVRQLLEQIIAKLGVPPFLLGLHWSTTERMSKQQADLLTSELERYRSLLTPVLRRILDTHLRLWGHTAPFAVEWQDISLQDTAELAQARYDNARAAVLEEQLTEKGEIV